MPTMRTNNRMYHALVDVIYEDKQTKDVYRIIGSHGPSIAKAWVYVYESSMNSTLEDVLKAIFIKKLTPELSLRIHKAVFLKMSYGPKSQN